ncbi:hypothetical protein [Vibrio barjaei]|uniref:hypothetical protein n=1 Tax=Vibrio barjaei TaxID=1676683 RepID=UPI0022838DF7|nr:hypothetical protein [Vibrio barjaei]MCY9873943.1 hypothetical protein [Vibrio barjaei]
MTCFNNTDALTHNLEALREDPARLKNDESIKTAKQWLAKEKRYPTRFERGYRHKKGVYYALEQTIPVYSESDAMPIEGARPIRDTYKNKYYYYEDECLQKKTRKQWWSEDNRLVKSSAQPVEIRNGFNHVQKQKLEIKYYLKSDTFKPKPKKKQDNK